MQDSSTTVLTKETLHESSFEGESCIYPHELRARLRELKVGKYGRDAMGGGALVLAFRAVAGIELDGFLCWCGKFDFATLAASFHARCFGCHDGLVLLWLLLGGVETSVRGTRQAKHEAS